MYGSSSAETKLSCIRAKLQKLYNDRNNYDLWRKSPDVPVMCSPKVVRKKEAFIIMMSRGLGGVMCVKW